MFILLQHFTKLYTAGLIICWIMTYFGACMSFIDWPKDSAPVFKASFHNDDSVACYVKYPSVTLSHDRISFGPRYRRPAEKDFNISMVFICP